MRRGLGAPAREEEEEPVEEDKMDTDEQAEKPAEESDDSDDDDEEQEDGAPVASTSAQPLDDAPKLHTTLPRNFRTTPQTRRLLANALAYLVRKARPAPSGEAPDLLVSLEDLVRHMVDDVAAVEELDGGERANGGRSAKGRRKGKGKGRGQEEGSSNVFAEGLTWVAVESCAVCPPFLLLPRSPC